MRAKEFISSNQRTDEIAPIIGAIGAGLLRGGAMAGQMAARGLSALGSAAAKGAANAVKGVGTTASSIGKQAIGTVASTAAKSLGQTVGTNLGNKLTGQGGQNPPPAVLPPNTKLEPIPPKPGDKPGSLRMKIGDTEFILDDPKAIQQLGQLGVAK